MSDHNGHFETVEGCVTFVKKNLDHDVSYSQQKKEGKWGDRNVNLIANPRNISTRMTPNDVV